MTSDEGDRETTESYNIYTLHTDKSIMNHFNQSKFDYNYTFAIDFEKTEFRLVSQMNWDKLITIEIWFDLTG